MDFITINNGNLIIPKKILNIDFLMNKGNLTLPIIQKKTDDSLNLHGFTLEIRLNLNNPVKLIYNYLIETFPDLLKIINKSVISYGECVFDNNLMLALTWIYKFYYNYNVVLFLPKVDIIYNFNETFIKDRNYFISDNLIINISLETLEQFQIHTLLKVPNVTIFGYSDFVFKDISQRRLNTQMKKILKKSIVHIFGLSSLKILQIPCFENIQYYEFTNKPLINFNTMFDNISLIDLLDSDSDIYSSNEAGLIDLISELTNNNKRIYLSLNLPMDKLKNIESKIKLNGISISRKDNLESKVVINSSKTTKNIYQLKGTYSVFIMIFDKINSPMEIIDYLKFIGNNDVEIYFDSSNIKNIEKCMSLLYKGNKEPFLNKISIKDSDEFETYEECKLNCNKIDPVLINEYYTIDAKDTLGKLNLSNLKKNDYDIIRNYVKMKLMNIFNVDIKTCQLSTPCSPRDRSKKLNSLSNKISSFDYRCDVTCEIFKDYSIGVLVWNEIFADRTNLDNICDTYIYQTTNGNWKYTIIN